ncbi:MAG: hypothetical protein DRN49_05990 [Thaumarchaeota archaeon]|nr:MAG: hypothetical protein DRN49_05990 [Nitrososphaerota archaeon]
MNHTIAFELLLEGEWVRAVAQPYTAYIGGFFWLFLFGLLLAMSYFKSQNVVIPTMLSLVILGSVEMASWLHIEIVPAEVKPLLFIFVVFGIAVSIVSAVLRGE